MDKKEKKTVKEMIQKALLDLMREKPYMDITVTDIIKKAQVARVSYYRNYSGIDEILDSIVKAKEEKMSLEIKSLMSGEIGKEEWAEILEKIFESKLRMKEQYTFTMETNRPYLYSKMELRMQEKIIELSDDIGVDKYQILAKIGAISAITNAWLKSGAKETPKEMSHLVCQLISQ